MAKVQRVKEATSIRLSREAKRLIELLSEQLGVPKTSVIGQAVRVAARREKVTLREGKM